MNDARAAHSASLTARLQGWWLKAYLFSPEAAAVLSSAATAAAGTAATAAADATVAPGATSAASAARGLRALYLDLDSVVVGSLDDLARVSLGRVSLGRGGLGRSGAALAGATDAGATDGSESGSEVGASAGGGPFESPGAAACASDEFGALGTEGMVSERRAGKARSASAGHTTEA